MVILTRLSVVLPVSFAYSAFRLFHVVKITVGFPFYSQANWLVIGMEYCNGRRARLQLCTLVVKITMGFSIGDWIFTVYSNKRRHGILQRSQGSPAAVQHVTCNIQHKIYTYVAYAKWITWLIVGAQMNAVSANKHKSVFYCVILSRFRLHERCSAYFERCTPVFISKQTLRRAVYSVCVN